MNLAALQKRVREAKPRKLVDGFTFQQPLKHGWLLTYLLQGDAITLGRWEHWFKIRENGGLIAEPIPEIHWTSERGESCPGRKMLEQSLDCITRCGSWRGWSSWRYV